MKLIEFNHWEDFGHEFYLNVLKNFLQLRISHCEYFVWHEPNIKVEIGLFSYESLFSFSFSLWNLNLKLNLFSWF